VNISKKSKKEQDIIIETARNRFQLAEEAETDIRKEALDDLKFRAGDQWPESIKRDREIDSRPYITVNKLPQFVRQVTNDQRQNRPSIKVSPVDDDADIDTAKVYQGLIRHIEYNSNADVAYDTAFEAAVTKGSGYFRIITDYCDPYSFNQEIFIKRIRNSFAVYLDPTYQEPDGSDVSWGFVFETMSKDDFKALYPNAELTNMEDWASVGNTVPGWAEKDTCRVAEYFYKTYKEVNLLLLSNQQVIAEEDFVLDKFPEGIKVIEERKTTLPAIKWCKMNGIEILEETDWPGQWIPIIPVLGDELDIDGQKQLEGIIRHAKDPQRMYNYWVSAETETIALAPRAPYIGAEGQFEGHENEWKTANTRNHAYLEYKPSDLMGNPTSAPQRNAYEPPVQAITQARMLSSDDMKSTTGVYDASLGQKSNENSGIAIQRRNQQSQTNNFHYVDNLTRSLKHAGKIILDLIPHIYDTARTVRIVGADDEQEVVKINQMFEKKGKQVSYNLGHGKYDITMDVGPSYATKRQEAVESMLGLIQAYPQAAQYAGDLMVKNMDWPGSAEIAERLKKTLPPGIADDKDDEQQEIPQEVQQQLEQMGQLTEQLTEQLNQANDQIKNKSMELQSKEKIEFSKLDVEREKIASQETMLAVKEELTNVRESIKLLHLDKKHMESMQDRGSFGAQSNYENPDRGEY